MVNATDELMSDTQGTVLEQYLTRVAGEEISFVVSDAIMNGSGTGQPLGILAAPALLTVAKDVGQAAATVTSSNIANMWARLWAGCRSNAVWLINQDVESQLQQMTIGSGASTLFSYLPPGGLADKPQGTLLDQQVMPIRVVRGPRRAGDIVLADMRQYVIESADLVEIGPVDPSPLRLRRGRSSASSSASTASRGDGTAPLTPRTRGRTAVVLRRPGDAELTKQRMKDEG